VTDKQKAIEAIQTLPDNAGFEDVMDRLYFVMTIERRLESLDRGEGISHEEAKRRLSKWLK
jgi:hypothetical protein